MPAPVKFLRYLDINVELFFLVFKIKWPKSDDKHNFRGRWVIGDQTQAKVCGDTLEVSL